jgi:hypothetical protein
LEIRFLQAKWITPTKSPPGRKINSMIETGSEILASLLALSPQATLTRSELVIVVYISKMFEEAPREPEDHV